MPSAVLAEADHERDLAFYQALHGSSASQRSTFIAMLSKNSSSQQVAADAYFKHWDNKDARIETEQDREVRMVASFQLRNQLIIIGPENRLCQLDKKVSCLPLLPSRS